MDRMDHRESPSQCLQDPKIQQSCPFRFREWVFWNEGGGQVTREGEEVGNNEKLFKGYKGFLLTLSLLEVFMLPIIVLSFGQQSIHKLGFHQWSMSTQWLRNTPEWKCEQPHCTVLSVRLPLSMCNLDLHIMARHTVGRVQHLTQLLPCDIRYDILRSNVPSFPCLCFPELRHRTHPSTLAFASLEFGNMSLHDLGSNRVLKSVCEFNSMERKRYGLGSPVVWHL